MRLFLCIYLAVTLVSPILSGPWFPSASESGIKHLPPVFHRVEGDTVESLPRKVAQVVNSVLTKKQDQKSVGEQFQWYALTAFRDSSQDNGEIWLVLGGSVPNVETKITSPFTKFANGVIGCRFRSQQFTPYGFTLENCEPLDLQYVEAESNTREKGGSGLLGMGMASLELVGAKNGAVLVYCDPLWRADGLHAGGRCQILLRRAGQWSNSTHSERFDFCTSSGHSQPCGGGFTVDLLQMDENEIVKNKGNNNSLPYVKLMVGLPFAQPHGEVQVIENVLNRYEDTRAASSSIEHILGTREKFGTKVAWTPEMSLKNNHKRQSTLLSELKTYLRSEFTQWTRENLALITSSAENRVLAYRHSRAGHSEHLFDIRPTDSRMNTDGKEKQNDDFGSGFGQAIETVIVPADTGSQLQRAEYAVILGAPFHSSTKKGPNLGRVYIMCPGMINVTEEPNYLDGVDSQSFFGYSLARLGDVDGDGIDDVAIGAPGLYGSTEEASNPRVKSPVVGKVYIHRVTTECKLDPEPIQVLNSPDSQPGDGFGIGLARGIDIDSDGWPELFVTSLQSSSRATYVYSMPHRLRAQCHISVPPVYGFAPFQVGSKIPVTITIRLFDLHKGNWVPIPAGVSSSETRLHQINPDISWQERYVNRTSGSSHNSIDGKDADSFFASLVNKGLDLTRPRFTLAGDRITSISVNNGGTQMLVRFSLEAQYAAQSVDLSAIPLRVGYRSHMSSATCPTFHAGNRLCIKSEQPLIDWSSCTGQIELDRHICVPDPQCLADVTVEKLTPQVNAPEQELEFGNSKTRQQLVRFRLTNRGPTKSTGVGVQLRVLGRWGTGRPVGVQLAITQVVVDKNNQGKTGDKIWSANIAEDGSAALISSKPHYWFYPNESIQFNVSLFAEGLREMVNLPLEQWDLHIANISSVNPGLSIRVASAVTDPSPDNDEQFVHYNLTYKPRVEISAGVQPTTIIDNRKTATVTESKPSMSKVFSHEIGPRVDHMFLIENRGQTTLHNLTLVLDLPIETADGKLLLYLTDRARRLSTAGTATQWETMLPHLVGANGQNLGDCVLPREYTNQFGFSILEYEPERHRVKRSATAGTYIRSKTPTEDDVTIQRLDDPESEVHMDIPLASSAYPRRAQPGNTAFARAERGRIYLRCPPFSRTQSTTNTSALPNWHKCVEIRCNVARLEKSDTVRLRWTGWLWAATYFALHTPDVQLTSRLRVANWGQPPESVRFYQLLTDYQQTSQTRLSDLIQFDYPDPAPVFEMKQSIIFYNVHPDVIHQVPWWPIVVGVVVGSLLLATLGICCYCCGFFRRKRIPGKVEAKMHTRGIRSSSKDRLLSSNGDEPDNNGKSGVPSFLSTKPRTETAISAVPSSKSVSERRVKMHRKAPDQTEFLVQASPNLLCAEEPEPPSPKIPRSYTAPPDWEVEDDEREGIENWQGTGVSFPAESDPTEPESDAHARSLQQLPVTKADQHTEAELPGNAFAQQRAGEKPDTGQTTDAKEPSESEENSDLKKDEVDEEQVKVGSTDDENSKINKNEIMDS